MNPRLIAACIAAPLVLVLAALALAVPLPFASFSPGPTFDILGKDPNGAEVVQVAGHKVFHDDGPGQLRFTTVSATRAGNKLTLATALARWFDDHDAVLPYSYVHPPSENAGEERQQGAVEMANSQDFATAAALHELGIKTPLVLKVAAVDKGAPAYGKLEADDVLVKIDGVTITSPDQVVKKIKAVGTHPVTFDIRRDRIARQVTITPAQTKDGPRIGITQGIDFDFPFDVQLHVDPTVGGPSAGLMFALAIYDTLTPGPLTGGAIVAGTGALGSDGQVQPIGGIAQKIAASEEAHVQLFFVPKGNCPDVKDLHPKGMKLVEATSVHEALQTLKKWAADHNATVPVCKK